MWDTWVQFLDQEDPLEKGMETHSSIFAWRIPWTEVLEGYSPWGCIELDMTEQLPLYLSVQIDRCSGAGLLDHMAALFLVF